MGGRAEETFKQGGERQEGGHGFQDSELPPTRAISKHREKQFLCADSLCVSQGPAGARHAGSAHCFRLTLPQLSVRPPVGQRGWLSPPLSFHQALRLSAAT